MCAPTWGDDGCQGLGDGCSRLLDNSRLDGGGLGHAGVSLICRHRSHGSSRASSGRRRGRLDLPQASRREADQYRSLITPWMEGNSLGIRLFLTLDTAMPRRLAGTEGAAFTAAGSGAAGASLAAS